MEARRGGLEESWAFVVDDEELLSKGDGEDPKFALMSLTEKCNFLIDSILSEIKFIHDNEYSTATHRLLEDSLSMSNPKGNELDRRVIQSMRQIKKQLLMFLTEQTTGEELKRLIEELFKSVYGEAVLQKTYKVGDDDAKSPIPLIIFKNTTGRCWGFKRALM